MSTRVVLLETVDDLRILRRGFPEAHEFLLVVPQSLEALMISEGLDYRLENEFLPDGGIDAVRSQCAALMDSWYLFNGLTEHGAHHMGVLFGYDYHIFSTVVRRIMVLGGLLEKEMPGEIIVSDRVFGLASEVLEAHSPGTLITIYRPGPVRRVVAWVMGNPYLRYLLKPRKFSLTLREIRDYLARCPAEFLARGTLLSVPDKVDVLFTLSHENNVPVASGPFKELFSRGHKVLTLVQDLDGGAVLRRLPGEGVNDYIRLGDIIKLEHSELHLKLRREFTERWERAISGGFTGHLDYMGVKVLKHIDIAKLRWVVTRLMPYYIVAYEAVREFVSTSGCQTVVAMNDILAPGMVMALAARGCGVASVDIQHGAIGRQNHRRMTADKWCVWGQADKDFLLSLGMQEDSVVITGNPGYDELVAKVYDTDLIRARASVPKKFRSVVLWAPTYVHHLPQFGSDFNEKVLARLVKACSSMPEIMFMVKPHPADTMCGKAVQVGGPPNLRVLKASFPLDKLLHISSVVMTWNSTVIREAVLLDKPIVGFNPYPLDEVVPCVSEGVAVEVRDIEGLKGALADLLGGNADLLEKMRVARLKYIEKYFYKVDGKASKRVADEIEHMSDKLKAKEGPEL